MRYGARMLWKHRLGTRVCARALALGIGANTTMFSGAEGFLAHPVPIENADRIVALVDSRQGQDIDRTPVAPATYFDWKQQAHSFDELGFYAWREVNLTGDREPQKVQAFQISANLFGLLGVHPQLGRAFLPEEQEPGKEQEIILGHALWEQRYASDTQDRKSTRLNSSHQIISYAVFCLKKKKIKNSSKNRTSHTILPYQTNSS